MTSCKLRAATAADLPAITAIYNEAVRNTTATFDTVEKTVEDRRAWLDTHDSRYPVIVAELGGTIAGWGSLSRWSDRAAYDGTCENSVYVDASSRGKQIGAALLRELLAIARLQGLHTVIARIADGNPASLRLHERAGFARIGTMRQVGRKFGKLIDVHMYQFIIGS